MQGECKYRQKPDSETRESTSGTLSCVFYLFTVYLTMLSQQRKLYDVE
jgi:hypothetical protein